MDATTEPEPATAPVKPTHINGVEIAATEQAAGPHPNHPEQIVPFQNITKALLANGDEVFLCDGPEVCDYYSPRFQSVLAHRSKHRVGGARASLYDDETLRMVMRESLLAKRTDPRKWAQIAADVLNARHIKTVQKKPWTASTVSNLYRKFHSTVKVRVPGPGRTPGVKNGEGKAARARTARAVGQPVLLTEVKELLVYIEHALVQANNLVAFVEAGRYDTAVDPVVAAKAEKWDRMQELMGR